MPSIIVFSHLRWDFVFQRPQHLMTRLAQFYSVIFVEEPVFDSKESYWEVSSPTENITVCRPHTSSGMPGFHDDQLPQLRKMLHQIVDKYSDPIVWFYTPMALPLLQEIQPSLVVYDCMDELSAFKNAPKQLLQRESALLKRADVVFTGGPSLYRAKRDRHHNVHCFSSSVDVSHFQTALDRSVSFAGQKDIPAPRLGFYGVIDERFDTALLCQIAEARPEWQFILVGPVVKIDPAILPQRDNIHYFGQQSYQALPQFLAGWDVCLLPFALNESTRFISPTKTLEYMAAELPIVSTRVTDVADIYDGIVHIADDAKAFINACEISLMENENQRAQRISKMRAVVASTSWNETAMQMYELMEKAKRQHRSDLHLSDLENEPITDVESLSEINPLPAIAISSVKPSISEASPVELKRSLSS